MQSSKKVNFHYILSLLEERKVCVVDKMKQSLFDKEDSIGTIKTLEAELRLINEEITKVKKETIK